MPEFSGNEQKHKSNLNNDRKKRESKANSLESEAGVPNFRQQRTAQDGLLLSTGMFWAHARNSWSPKKMKWISNFTHGLRHWRTAHFFGSFVTRFSPGRHKFSSTAVKVEIVVNKVAMRRGFFFLSSSTSIFTCQLSSHRCSTFMHLSSKW